MSAPGAGPPLGRGPHEVRALPTFGVAVGGRGELHGERDGLAGAGPLERRPVVQVAGGELDAGYGERVGPGRVRLAHQGGHGEPRRLGGAGHGAAPCMPVAPATRSDTGPAARWVVSTTPWCHMLP